MAKSKTQTKETKETKVAVEPVVQVKAQKKTQKGGDAEPKEKKAKRSFKALYVNPEGNVVIEGRYCGAKPKQAGCKALTGIYKLFAKAKKQLKGEIYFGVRETTRGSRNKTYYYCGERVVLDEPVELQIGGGETGKTITYKYNSNVKKAQESDCDHLANPTDVEYEEPKKVQKKGKGKVEAEEPVVEVVVEPVVEAVVEPVVEVKAKGKGKAKAEPKAELKVEPKVEVKVETTKVKKSSDKKKVSKK